MVCVTPSTADMDAAYPSESNCPLPEGAFIYAPAEGPSLEDLGREAPVALVVNGETRYVYGRLRDCISYLAEDLPRSPDMPTYWEFPVTVIVFKLGSKVHTPKGHFRMMLRIDTQHLCATLGRHEWSLPITSRGPVGVTDDFPALYHIFKTPQPTPVATEPVKRSPDTYWQIAHFPGAPPK